MLVSSDRAVCRMFLFVGLLVNPGMRPTTEPAIGPFAEPERNAGWPGPAGTGVSVTLFGPPCGFHPKFGLNDSSPLAINAPSYGPTVGVPISEPGPPRSALKPMSYV